MRRITPVLSVRLGIRSTFICHERLASAISASASRPFENRQIPSVSNSGLA